MLNAVKTLLSEPMVVLASLAGALADAGEVAASAYYVVEAVDTMKLLIDTREQAPLEFPNVEGVEVLRETMTVGDYTARHTMKNGVELLDTTVMERKGLGDLFGSFTRQYEREKAKWERAKLRGLTYLLCIEGTVSEVLAGHTYWKAGEVHEAKKSGLAQLRQLCSVERRYGIQVKFFATRKEMELWMLEYFLAQERIHPPP